MTSPLSTIILQILFYHKTSHIWRQNYKAKTAGILPPFFSSMYIYLSASVSNTPVPPRRSAGISALSQSPRNGSPKCRRHVSYINCSSISSSGYLPPPLLKMRRRILVSPNKRLSLHAALPLFFISVRIVLNHSIHTLTVVHLEY